MPDELQLFCKTSKVGNLMNRQPQWKFFIINILASSLRISFLLVLVPNVEFALPAEFFLLTFILSLFQREC